MYFKNNIPSSAVHRWAWYIAGGYGIVVFEKLIRRFHIPANKSHGFYRHTNIHNEAAVFWLFGIQFKTGPVIGLIATGWEP